MLVYELYIYQNARYDKKRVKKINQRCPSALRIASFGTVIGDNVWILLYDTVWILLYDTVRILLYDTVRILLGWIYFYIFLSSISLRQH